MDRAPAASHPAHADQHPASVQFKSHLPPLWIPVGLKQCIHLMFYLRAVMKFLYQLGRCDESFMSWVPETLLEYILAQCLYLSCINTQGLDEFPSSGWNSGTPSLPPLHSSSPLEYLDPSKRTWTKVLDKAAATQCLGLSATDLGEFWGITWFCCWWCLFCTVWELEASPAIPCLLAGLILRNRAEVLLTILYHYTG